ncbi:MAG: hypothetical protein JSR37_09985 [Verrucomicrobia bacterium]|nr:hypothetical protein [Verrucomicrobiota bacterium]MBS0635919.1 hypothetical protein [Verrucomicrobiota bacterium]
MADSGFDPGISAVQVTGAQTNAEVIQQNMAVAAQYGLTNASDGAFNGTIGDLQKKYPEIYQKLVLESIARQIVQQCQHSNDHFIEEMKKHRDG